MMGGERPRPREGVRYLLGGVSEEPGAPGIGSNGITINGWRGGVYKRSLKKTTTTTKKEVRGFATEGLLSKGYNLLSVPKSSCEFAPFRRSLRPSSFSPPCLPAGPSLFPLFVHRFRWPYLRDGDAYKV